jgi:proteinaceous RNase P
VAYQSQNYKSGRFSFQQIQLVVDTLRKLGKRILVIIPQCYTQAVVPNSIRTQNRRDAVSVADQAFIQQLRDENMLYVVPNGSNDDWFWLYATLYKGRRSPAFVVTNDLMRDHKVAFPEARTFMRWRTSHVMYFGLSRALSCDQDDQNDSDLDLQQGADDEPEAFFYGPG